MCNYSFKSVEKCFGKGVKALMDSGRVVKIPGWLDATGNKNGEWAKPENMNMELEHAFGVTIASWSTEPAAGGRGSQRTFHFGKKKKLFPELPHKCLFISVTDTGVRLWMKPPEDKKKQSHATTAFLLPLHRWLLPFRTVKETASYFMLELLPVSGRWFAFCFEQNRERETCVKCLWNKLNTH